VGVPFHKDQFSKPSKEKKGGVTQVGGIFLTKRETSFAKKGGYLMA